MADQNTLIQEIKKLQKQIAALENNSLGLAPSTQQKEQIEKLKEEEKQLQRQLDAMEANISARDRLTDSIAKMNEALDVNYITNDRLTERSKVWQEANKEATRAFKQLKESGQATTEQLEEFEDQIDESKDKLDTLTLSAGGVLGVVEDLLGVVGLGRAPALLKTFLVGKEGAGFLFKVNSGLAQVFETSQKIGVLGVVKGLGLAIASTNVFYLQQLDRVLVGLNKATGASNLFSNTVQSVGNDLRQYNIGFQEAAGAIQAFANATTLTNSELAKKEELLKYAARMENIGIAADTTASIFEELTRGLGRNQDQFMDFQNEISKLAIAIGETPTKMAEDFKSAYPSIAGFGKNVEQVFIDLKKQSRALGMEMSELISFVEKFDEFDTAAQTAGQLNAILGTQINSLQLATASYEDRAKIIQDAIGATGVEIEKMSHIQRKAVAGALGVNVAQLNKFLTAQGDATKKVEEASMANIDLEAAQKRSATAIEKLKNIFTSLLVVTMPVIDSIHAVIDAIAGFVQSIKETKIFGFLISWSSKIVGYFILFSVVVVGAVAAVGTLVGIVRDAFSIVTSFAKGIWSAITSIYAKITSIFADTAATNANTAANAANTTAAEVNAAAKASQATATDAAAAAQTRGATATKVAGRAAGSAALGMLAFGAAVALVGAGIWLAATGMAALVAAMDPENYGKQLLFLGGAMLIFAAAVAAAALVGATTAEGIALLGLALIVLAIPIEAVTTSTTKLVSAISSMFSSFAKAKDSLKELGSILKTVASQLNVSFSASVMISEIAKLTNALDKVPTVKTVALGSTLEKMVQLSANTTEQTVRNVSEVVAAAETYSKIKFTPENQDAFLQMAKAISGTSEGTNSAGRGGAPTTQRPIQIEFQIGKEKFAKLVTEALDDFGR